jgi:RNA polymerase sigma-70 factor (ECF subfamily)
MSRPVLAAPRRQNASLAARASARRDETILSIWRRFRPLVRWTLMKMLGPDEEVRDLSQEAFLQLHRSVRALRSPDSIGAFVTGIAIRIALGEIRRRRVRGGQVLVPGQGLLPLSSGSPNPEAREAIARLLQVIGRLRPEDREVFVLHQIEGLEQKEICAAAGISISTVRRRLRRVQRRVEVLMNGDPALVDYAHNLRSRTMQRQEQEEEATEDPNEDESDDPVDETGADDAVDDLSDRAL